jgi:hypothetical protein
MLMGPRRLVLMPADGQYAGGWSINIRGSSRHSEKDRVNFFFRLTDRQALRGICSRSALISRSLTALQCQPNVS